MLNEIFKAFLITSLTGSAFAALIMLLKPLTRRIFSSSWHYYIWLAVLFVMLLPVRFTLPQRSTNYSDHNTDYADFYTDYTYHHTNHHTGVSSHHNGAAAKLK